MEIVARDATTTLRYKASVSPKIVLTVNDEKYNVEFFATWWRTYCPHQCGANYVSDLILHAVFDSTKERVKVCGCVGTSSREISLRSARPWLDSAERMSAVFVKRHSEALKYWLHFTWEGRQYAKRLYHNIREQMHDCSPANVLLMTDTTGHMSDQMFGIGGMCRTLSETEGSIKKLSTNYNHNSGNQIVTFLSSAASQRDVFDGEYEKNIVPIKDIVINTPELIDTLEEYRNAILGKYN